MEKSFQLLKAVLKKLFQIIEVEITSLFIGKPLPKSFQHLKGILGTSFCGNIILTVKSSSKDTISSQCG